MYHQFMNEIKRFIQNLQIENFLQTIYVICNHKYSSMANSKKNGQIQNHTDHLSINVV